MKSFPSRSSGFHRLARPIAAAFLTGIVVIALACLVIACRAVVIAVLE